MKYRKKPIEIEAIQLAKDNIIEVMHFIGISTSTPCEKAEDALEMYVKEIVPKEGLKIKTLEGTMKASIGDYIIKGVNGEFYPCKPDIFVKTYELVK